MTLIRDTAGIYEWQKEAERWLKGECERLKEELRAEALAVRDHNADADMRLACLKLANDSVTIINISASPPTDVERIIEDAQKLYDFTQGKPLTSSSPTS